MGEEIKRGPCALQLKRKRESDGVMRWAGADWSRDEGAKIKGVAKEDGSREEEAYGTTVVNEI